MAQLEQRNQSLESQVAERTRELSWVNQQLQRQLDENRELAERDALTRIANRYRLEKALQLECERAQLSPAVVADSHGPGRLQADQ